MFFLRAVRDAPPLHPARLPRLLLARHGQLGLQPPHLLQHECKVGGPVIFNNFSKSQQNCLFTSTVNLPVYYIHYLAISAAI